MLTIVLVYVFKKNVANKNDEVAFLAIFFVN